MEHDLITRMDYEGFITTVERAAHIGREDAERATRATLETLAERIAKGEALDLAAELPPELAPWISTTTDAKGFDASEFVRRVAVREGIDATEAERHVRAVFVALSRALTKQEFEDVAAELSSDFAPLLGRSPAREVISYDRFLERVVERAPVAGVDEARRATDAVLEVLAERIAGGEVDDLITRLPIEMHHALRLGVEHTGGKAARMSWEEFVRRVAEREGVDPARAADDAVAVLRTLREAVGDDEFFDITVQLPEDFKRAIGLSDRRSS
jgi:uncharacterized protein (DUF2267 family)